MPVLRNRLLDVLFFFCLFARERQIARRIAAKEIAVSRGTRGTANGREEKAKTLTADEPAVVPQPRDYGGQAADIRRWIPGENSGHDFIEVYLRPSVVVLFYSRQFASIRG